MSRKKRRFSGKKLLAARQAKGLSRMRLSRAIDFKVGPHQIRAYEVYGNCPTVDTMLEICAALDIAPQELTDAEG